VKITRRQLREIIFEAYNRRTGIPFRSPIDQSDAYISRIINDEQADNLKTFEDSDPKYAETLKMGLDLSRPEKDFKLNRDTSQTVRTSTGRLMNVVIPRRIVDEVIERASTVRGDAPLDRLSRYALSSAVHTAIYQIDSWVRMTHGRNESVIDYNVAFQGYRSLEYKKALASAKAQGII